MIMFKVCRRCLQSFSLRWKKNYERTMHTSKYIQKKLTLRAGAASVCLLSMTFLLGASRLALFTFEIHASIRWNWDPSSAWVASVSGVD